MAKQEQLPKIKPQEKPSLLNHGTGQGTFWGYWGGIIAALVGFKDVTKALKDLGTKDVDAVAKELTKNKAHLKLLGVTAAGMAIGAAIGGLLGKKQQEEEQTEGRVVKKPTSWNIGVLSGLGASIPVALGVKYLTRKLGAGVFIVDALGSAIGITGMVVGSSMRKKEMERDYNQALNQLGEQKIAEGMAYKNAALSPQEQTILEGLINGQKQGGHAGKLAESREQTAPLQMNL
ncbi:MAG: hypothetical protein ACOYJ2_00085 [Rickettsiales bacterium]